MGERATANSSANYGSTPSSMQIKNVRSIEFQTNRKNQTALSLTTHIDRRINASMEARRNVTKKRSETANKRDESPI